MTFDCCNRLVYTYCLGASYLGVLDLLSLFVCIAIGVVCNSLCSLLPLTRMLAWSG